MLSQFKSRQFVAFLVAGGLAAVANFGSRIVYSPWLGFSWAIVMAYATGMVTAFVLTRFFVFKQSQQPLKHSAFWFVLVNGVAVLQTWAISMLMLNYLLPAMGVEEFTHEIAHAAGVIVPVFTSYIGHKRLSFR